MNNSSSMAIWNDSCSRYEYEKTFRQKRFEPVLYWELEFYKNSLEVLKQILKEVGEHPNPIGVNGCPYLSEHNGSVMWIRTNLSKEAPRSLSEEIHKMLTDEFQMSGCRVDLFFKDGVYTKKFLHDSKEYLLFTIGQLYSSGCHDNAYVVMTAEERIKQAEERIVLIRKWIKNPPMNRDFVIGELQKGLNPIKVSLSGPEGIQLEVELPQLVADNIQSISWQTSYGQKASDAFLVLRDTHESGFTMNSRDEEVVPLPKEFSEQLYEKWLDAKFEAWTVSVKKGGVVTATSCKGMSVTDLPGGSLSTYNTHSDYIKPDGLFLRHYSWGGGRNFGYSHKEDGMREISRDTMRDYYILHGKVDETRSTFNKIFGVRHGAADDFTKNNVA